MSTEDSDESDESSGPDVADEGTVVTGQRTIGRSASFAIRVLPAIAMALALLAGFLKWESVSRQEQDAAASESVAVASETTVAILSYKPDTADQQLKAVRERLTGPFLDAYTTLVDDIVIPGAKEKKISAVAQVPAAASVSATGSHAVALVFVDQTVTVGGGNPTSSASSVRVTLDKVRGRWLVSGFDPV